MLTVVGNQIVKEEFTEKKVCCIVPAECKSTMSHSCSQGKAVAGCIELVRHIELSFCCTLRSSQSVFVSFLIVTCQEEYGRVRETSESGLEFGKHGLFRRIDCICLA